MKRIALFAVCCAVVAALTLRPAEAEPSLGIGSKAPALDIEHYFHEDDTRVTQFEDGKVYVVEFWATWCGPCIASMPHLAELQTKHRNDGVQIISVSDETVDEVEALLAKPYPGQKASFAEVTAAYTLTTDPDGSTQRDYMEAAGQNGIPTSFIVGKTGVIEWIGHPGELDEPLAAVLDGSWDREAFKADMEREQKFQEILQGLDQLAGRGRFEDASAMLADQIAQTSDAELKERLTTVQRVVQPQFNFMAGKATEADFAFYREERKATQGNAQALFRHAMTLYNIVQNGGKIGPLGAEVVEALTVEMENVEDDGKVAILELIARLHAVDQRWDEAIKAAEQGVELADGVSRSQKQRMTLLLDDLKSNANPESDSDSDGDSDQPATDE
ncbi:TlpA family protein disulfide reductase [Stieleria sp. ICT_E10.1]|uniref:TlpA family protein disulfide reductase n=1 Tax=Stieleria sedimenti TaxID=2976331 RepID=UPI00217FD221|nr:TlpA family protein disulfide reductase [Stieleria sedimenti]MCS7470971.1 TlpA family protein disulfide reductase [Stieleria sedimenti]